MLSAVGLGLRAFLLLTASVVLGLSVSLAKQQVVGSVPTETGFSVFAGATAFFVSSVGMAAMWFDRLDQRITMILDLLVSTFYLAAAVALTVALKPVTSCTATDQVAEYNRMTNKITSGGCLTIEGELACLHATSSDGTDLTPSRCKMARAGYIFEYIGFTVGIAMITAGYLLSRQGRGGTPTPNRSYQ
ncbi:marvel domain-containing protein [Xylaria bambusicola]|uniref:marvel domain-containing protein n=1 Tax=Xylaria bambusicola TaxID=326684 RepID=UPI002008842B|nr:marvel domain-containing protein [Xylaria bambusicola]KAI0502872.1 marvel domain-containing protein [Xylaria bambusicola]